MGSDFFGLRHQTTSKNFPSARARLAKPGQCDSMHRTASFSRELHSKRYEKVSERSLCLRKNIPGIEERLSLWVFARGLGGFVQRGHGVRLQTWRCVCCRLSQVGIKLRLSKTVRMTYMTSMNVQGRHIIPYIYMYMYIYIYIYIYHVC